MSMPRALGAAGQVALAFVAIFSFVGCDLVVGGLNVKGQASDEWARTYTLDPTGRIEVTNVNGKIEVTGWDEPRVQVTATRTARAATDEAARDLLPQIEIRDEARPDSIRLETKAPSGTRATVQYRLRVPRGAALELRTTNGAIDASGVRGRLKAVGTNGGVTGKDLAGPVEASTTNGGIRIDMIALAPDGLALETVNGGITLNLPRSAKVDLSARCVNGGIDVTDLPLEHLGEVTRRKVEARLNGGGPRVALETTNGSIRIGGKP